MKRQLLASASLCAVAPVFATVFATAAAAQECPPVTVADPMGIAAGAYPQQYDLAEFQSLASCALTFQENPAIGELNARITGNPAELPPVAERLPEEPLVVAPYAKIGAYGGVLDGLSNATEAGTSDLLSVRHVNLVRFSDDLQTIVPNVAKSWEWNDDFTELTFTLRRGHKWSDGAPFTAEDVAFWYNDVTMNKGLVEKPRDLWFAGGEPFTVEAVDEVTVKFTMAAPKPGLLASFATDFAQPFLPRHFFGPFHPDVSPDADEKAKALGFESGYALINFYYGASDWKDVPSPYLKDPAKIPSLPAAVAPTLESHITVEDTTEGRRVVANPYFHMVDTAGNQLPYFNEMAELYVNENEVRILKMVNGEIDYKSQSITLPDAPTLLDGQESGGYVVDLRPQIASPTITFNLTDPDMGKRALFSEKDWRLAMSTAINRDEINSVAYFDLGEPKQMLTFAPTPAFATEEQASFATEYDPDGAKAKLDALGVVDKDGDGWRDLPDGAPLTLNIQFATQGVATAVIELVAQHWQDVGVNATIKEVTPDEYRAAQSANELSVHVWLHGAPIPVLLGDPQPFIAPFGSYFFLRNGMLWAQYLETDGKEGVEPPAWVGEWKDLVLEWQQHLPGSPESDDLGAKLIEAQLDQLVFIGLVEAPNPIYHSTKLENFETPKTWSYEYYRVYPYRPQQWSLTE
tara:strand:- start:28 stop:2097 length:2070 start_codon:yes stop_codon:yes gene_type:complete